MSDEAAFLRALRERPDDETTRLVYTDWLDDRSDPRAEYLRAEAAWVALQPSDEQYRPLYRRVSRLAAGLEPEWFAAVSRMGLIVERAWAALPSDFHSSPAPPADPFREWKRAEVTLRELVSRVSCSDRSADRFCIPADMRAFYCGSSKRSDSHYDGPMLCEWAEIYADDFELERMQELDPEVWLQFSISCDSSWFFICCDLDHPHFGVVAEGVREGVDRLPWRKDADGIVWFRGRNLIHHLTDYLPTAFAPAGPSWLDVPRSKWATH
jgi:uncharacterized protein (TIGR02996 family)